MDRKMQLMKYDPINITLIIGASAFAPPGRLSQRVGAFDFKIEVRKYSESLDIGAWKQL